MVQQHPQLTVEHFNNVFKALVAKDLPSAPPLKGSQAAVIALGWSVLIIKNAKNESESEKSEFVKLIDYQTSLYQLALGSGNIKVSEKAFSVLKEHWEEKPELKTICFEKLISAEPSSIGIIFMSAIIRYNSEVDSDLSLLEKNKVKILDHFIKGLITVKVKPNSSHITSCRLILKAVTKDEFKTLILPALQRSMLRSPEIVLETVGAIVAELELDVSEFAVDMGKTLIQNLYSKNDNARSEAAESLKQVAIKCSDVSAIEGLLKQVFAVFNGSDGKITVVEYRINVLQVSCFFKATITLFYSLSLITYRRLQWAMSLGLQSLIIRFILELPILEIKE